MANRNRSSNITEVEKITAADKAEVNAAELGAVETAPPVPAQPIAAVPNFTLEYRREHPKNRCSYGVSGISGIVVFDRSLFADPTHVGPITLDVQLASPKANPKVDKAAAQAAKLKEKADKAAAKLAAQQAKIQEKADKAAAALKAAQDKVAAAQAKTEAPAAPAVSDVPTL